ncbi:hypothetical protein [Haliea sp.]|uniref:hypothetical protein n=1 Tax=Haliea sp. TaxID=1932666 RepID=UPI00352890A5
MPAYYVDEAGAPLFNDHGQLATDDDVYRSGYFTELDRLTLELCVHERAAGANLPGWLMAAELTAFQRQRSADREVA